MMTGAVALALGAGRGVLAWWPSERTPQGARTDAFVFDRDALTSGDTSSLAPMIAIVRRAMPTARTLHVALASPWCTYSELSLLPMRAADARAVLTRNVSRYWPVSYAEPAVAVEPRHRGQWLASAADGVVLDTIARCAAEAGFSQLRIIPAANAWAHSAGDAHECAFVLDGEATVLGAARGQLARVRRCRAADLAGTVSPVADALVLAARHAASCSAAELVGTRMRASRHARASRVMHQLALAGVAMLLAAACASWWGAHRRLEHVAVERAELQPVLAPVLATRDSLLQITEAFALMVRSASPSWSGRMAVLSQALSDDAYFTQWRGQGDSVLVEGRADDALRIVERLRAVRGVERVQSTAPVLAPDGTSSFSAIVHFRAGGQP